jgi:hypothetical protein
MLSTRLRALPSSQSNPLIRKRSTMLYITIIYKKTSADDHDLGSNLIRNGNLVP